MGTFSRVQLVWTVYVSISKCVQVIKLVLVGSLVRVSGLLVIHGDSICVRPSF